MTAGASRLTALIETAKDVSPDKRRELLRAVLDLYMAQPERFGAAALRDIDVILSWAAEAVDASERRELAALLAPAAAAPKGLIAYLARDEIAVADPVLRMSKALGEEDLLALIRDCSPAHLRAIARRRDLAETVSEALVEAGDEETLLALARNQGARFSAGAMRALITRARRIKALQEPIAERFDLPPQLLTQLYFFVSPALKREILKRSDMLDPALIEQAVTVNRKKTLDQAAREFDGSMTPAARLVVDALRENDADESLLKALIAERRPAEFLYAFAHYAGVDAAAAQAILKDRTFEALAVACRAIGLERQTFAKIVFGMLKGEGDNAKALRILDLYEKVPADAAERIMRFWRMRTEAAAHAAKTGARERKHEDDEEPLELRNRA